MEGKKQYISKQMGKYNNGKRILEFVSKLNPASAYNAFKIHAGTDEKTAVGRSIKSVIGINIVDYSISPTITVTANIEPRIIERLWLAANSGKDGAAIYQIKAHAYSKDSTGLSPVQILTIKRESFESDGKTPYKLKWFIEIENGKAKAATVGIGFDKSTYVKENKCFLRMGDSDFFYLILEVRKALTVWEYAVGTQLLLAQQQLENMQEG